MDGPELCTLPGHLIRRLHQVSTQVFAAAVNADDAETDEVTFAEAAAGGARGATFDTTIPGREGHAAKSLGEERSRG